MCREQDCVIPRAKRKSKLLHWRAVPDRPHEEIKADMADEHADARFPASLADLIARAGRQAPVSPSRGRPSAVTATVLTAPALLTKRASWIWPSCVGSLSVSRKASTVPSALIEMERGFQQAYRTALAAWRDGEREVQFPYGTWWMRVHHRARVAPGPA